MAYIVIMHLHFFTFFATVFNHIYHVVHHLSEEFFLSVSQSSQSTQQHLKTLKDIWKKKPFEIVSIKHNCKNHFTMG